MDTQRSRVGRNARSCWNDAEELTPSPLWSDSHIRSVRNDVARVIGAVAGIVAAIALVRTLAPLLTEATVPCADEREIATLETECLAIWTYGLEDGRDLSAVGGQAVDRAAALPFAAQVRTGDRRRSLQAVAAGASDRADGEGDERPRRPATSGLITHAPCGPTA